MGVTKAGEGGEVEGIVCVCVVCVCAVCVCVSQGCWGIGWSVRREIIGNGTSKGLTGGEGDLEGLRESDKVNGGGMV